MTEHTEKAEKRKESWLKSSLISLGKKSNIATKFISWLFICLALLWNWDGFWQTNIAFLNDYQKSFFPSKYNEEQLKVSRITRNNKLIDDILWKVERAEKRRDAALSELEQAQEKISSYLAEENATCRYYDTSLRMIDRLTKKYSEDELKRTLSCTSPECEQILYSRKEAASICN